MVALTTTRQVLADAWKALGVYVGASTTNSGAAATPAGEISGGGYARVATTWSSSGTGGVTGTQVLISVPAITAVWGFVAVSAGGNQFDNADITDTAFSTPGQLVLTPSFTVT